MTRPDALPRAFAAVRDRLAGDSTDRLLVGVAGPPAAGKSTLAAALAGMLIQHAVPAVAVGMDGFHLANLELERLGLSDRKGAPQTFDAAGFVHLLRRLRAGGPDVIYAPVFNRALNESIGSALPVPPTTRVVVVEGNYLLLDDGPWRPVRDLFDLVMYLDAPSTVRREALVRRQLGRGLGLPDARAWVHNSDEVNARIIAGTRDRADVILERGAFPRDIR